MSAQPSPSDVPPDVVNQMNMRDIKRAVAAKNPHLNTDSKGFRADATAMNRARDRANLQQHKM